MERTKGSRVSKLLAVSLCVTMALMGIQVIPNTSAKGGGDVVWYHEYAGNILIHPGWNLITPLCIPKTANNQAITPQWWCDNSLNMAGIPTMIVETIQWIDTANGGATHTYYEVNHTYVPAGAFVITIGKAYWVEADEKGYLVMSTGATGKSLVPKLYNENLIQGWNLVGPVWSCGPAPLDPVPDPDPHPGPTDWTFYGSWFKDYLFDVNGNPYTGAWTISMWNPHTQTYNTVTSAYPTADFVHHSTHYPEEHLHNVVGTTHSGLYLYIDQPGVFWKATNPQGFY